MDLAAKKITSDWIDLRDKMTSPIRLKAYLRVEDYAVGQFSEALKKSSQEGVIEFKRRMVNHLFSFVAKLSRSTPSQAEVMDEEAHIRSVLFNICIENLFAQGNLKSKVENSPSTSAPSRQTVSEIIQEVQKRITLDPELMKNNLVKSILLDLQLYKKEYAAFSQLSPNISDERAPAFFLNFKSRIDGITTSANNHYRELLNQDEEQSRKSATEKEESILANPALVNLLTTQAQEVSHIRSTLAFAAEEGYKFRDILLRLLTKKEQLLALLEEESKVYQAKQPPGESGNAMVMRMTRNMILYFDSLLVKK
ncbi:MAG: hypothetical protein A2Z96_04580 [Spirochaetes bacterium GWB1_48_6]|nr:MAG: hypothetical protein A2Z96_04580 [Spirochaetes bacterium GWB1_48_6]